MKKKVETPKPMSDYEVDAMWMSYRYAIGRHTIASVMHAGHLVQNVYGRIPKEHLGYNVYDMRKEIAYHLQCEFNFDTQQMAFYGYIDPFKALMEFEKTLAKDEKEIGLLNYLKDHKVSMSLDDNCKFVFKSQLSTQSLNPTIGNLEDLLVWANAANALDSDKHHKITTEYNGEVKTVDAFEIYRINHNLEGDMFCIDYVDINTYLENPFVHKWIAKEYIKEIKQV